MAITVKHTKVSTVPDSADTSLVRPSDWNADHTLTGLGTMAEQDANNVNITGGSISGATVSGYIPTSEKGANNGVATLDAGGKVPTSQIPLQGDLNYQGTWNATTNTPTLTSSTGTKGYYYVVDVAGTTNLDGITDWQIGDWAIFNGTVWQKVDNTDAVTSVNGQVGTVVLTTTNIAEGTNEYFTQARARQSISAGTGISYDNGTGVVTNAAPDQTVGLTAGTGISVSGTYPNFTISNTSPSSGGDVVGPASATDNAIARFDTTTGKLIQNSVVTVSDTGVVDGVIHMNDVDYIDFDTTYATTLGVGQLGWNGNDTLGLGMIGGNVIQHIGEDQFFYTKATSAITKGQVVMFTGAVGASGVPTGAPATGITDGSYIMGIAAESIALNGFGLIQTFGTLRNVNTTGYVDGDILWYDPTVTGGLTKTKPSAPNVKVQMAAVINGGSSGGGTILIRINSGSTLGGTDSNAEIVSPTGGQTLIYDQTDGYWKNATLTDGTAISITEGASGTITIANTGVTALTASTGISVSGSTGSVTVTNTAPDQTVSLTGAGTTSISGTYPNFTITSNDQYVGTVTSVAATAGTGISVSGSPITSSGTLTITNTAPDQVVSLTAGTGISTSGTYPAFTITNSAPDQTVSLTGTGTTTITGTYPNFTINSDDQFDGTVTSVDLTAGTGISVSGGPITSSGSITVTNSAPDQVVSLTGAGTTSISGTYPNFTITSNDQYTGTVTSVSGSAPIASSGGNTPTISITQATTSTDGYLSSTDWNTFNNKQPAGTYVTSVGATSPVTSTGGTTPTIAMPAANGSTNGYLTSTDWTTFNSKGNGTVTSVGGTGTVNGITLTGTVTSSGNLTLGGTLSGVNLTTQVTGTLPIANGGTNITTYTSGDILYASASNTLSKLAKGTDGQVLTLASGFPSWGTAASSNITTLGLWENAATISANYTIGTNNNAVSAGPITVSTGVTVTVPTGSTWTVV